MKGRKVSRSLRRLLGRRKTLLHHLPVEEKDNSNQRRRNWSKPYMGGAQTADCRGADLTWTFRCRLAPRRVIRARFLEHEITREWGITFH